MSTLTKETRESFEQIFKSNNPHIKAFEDWLEEVRNRLVTEMIAVQGNSEYTLELKGQIRNTKYIQDTIKSVKK